MTDKISFKRRVLERAYEIALLAPIATILVAQEVWGFATAKVGEIWRKVRDRE